MQRPSPFAPAAPPRPAAPKPAAKPLARSYTPLKLEVQRGAKELVVDDFVDTYFRERPKTIRGPRLDELPLPPPEAPATVAQGEPRAPVDEESGIRALGATRDEIELSIAEHEEDLVALEAQLADRDEHIESMQGEMLRLQMELESLKRQRASARPPSIDVSVDPSADPREPGDGERGPTSAGSEVLAPARTAAPAPPRSTARIALAAVLLLGAAGAVAVVALRPSREAPRGDTSAPQAAAASPTVASSAPPAAEEPVTAAKTAAKPDAAPAVSTSAAAPPAAPESALPPASDVEEVGLLSFQAHLTVRSDIDAEVVVQGQPVGRTNQKLLVRCGPRNVRIRDERGWRSAGEHVRITCMHAVTVPIRATP